MNNQTTSREQARGRTRLRIFGAVLLLTGAVLTIGGLWLVTLGGSWYYVLAGSGLVVSGGLFFVRRRAGAWAFTAVFVGTIVWAIWEAGFNFWLQVPRLIGFIVLGIFAALLFPFLSSVDQRHRVKRPAYAAAAVLALIFVAFLALMFVPHGTIQSSSNRTQAAPTTGQPAGAQAPWSHYGRTPAGTRYAPLGEINKDNVHRLEVAWTFRTGDPAVKGAEDQNTPIQIGDAVYICTPHNIVFALDAETGAQRWKFDPKASTPRWQRCRGVGYYETADTSAQCARRIILSTIDARLIALDAATGTPCAQFGNQGTVDLKLGMGPVKPGFHFQTSQPTVVRNLVVIGGWVYDNQEVGEPSGAVRAFSADTGELVWAWDLGNPAITRLPPEGQTYTRGTPNYWSTAAFDDALGLIYLPLGNATPDFWGAHRSKLAEAYSSSLVALDIDSGRERWKFQTVYHDIWDYDLGAQPALYDIPDGKGGVTPVVIQATKTGQIYVLDRRTGVPVTEVQQHPVPQNPQKGDWTSPVQPFSIGMPAIGTEPLTEADMWGATFFDQLYCRIQFKRVRYDGMFTPPTTQGTLFWPGYYGGMNWGGVSIHEPDSYLIVNDIRIAQWVQLLPREVADAQSASDGYEGFAPQRGTPYGVTRAYFQSLLEVPCNRPPYGTMTAIDLRTRKVVWQVPMGTVYDAGPLGIKTFMPIPIGMPTIGGPVTTVSGLVFFAGTQDYYLRALDVHTGNELWKGRLPVGAQAGPMTYRSPQSGRQFVVISAGGARERPDRGDYVVAYALPK